jgi:WD40 repeat protein
VHLQVVCRRLWEVHIEPERVQLSDLENIRGDQGVGVDIVLADYYAETVKSAADAGGIDERVVRNWFGRQLIVAGIRRPALKGDELAFGINARCRDVLDKAFLIRSEPRGGAVWYELAHDRLIGPVQRNNERWRHKNLNQFQLKAELWDEGNRSDALLLHDDALRSADTWVLSAPSPMLTKVERLFLDRCRELHDARTKEQAGQRRLKIVRNWFIAMGGLHVFLFILIVPLYFAYSQSAKLAKASKHAETIAKKLADLEKDRAKEAKKEIKALENKTTVREQITQNRTRSYATSGGAVSDAMSIVEQAKRLDVDSPDSETNLRTALGDAVWSTLPDDIGMIMAATYSGTGTRVAVGGRDGTVRAWSIGADGNVDQAQRLLDVNPELDSEKVSVTALAFSADTAESRLIVGRANGSVAVYRQGTKERLSISTNHSSAVREILVSADDRWFVSLALDGTGILSPAAKGDLGKKLAPDEGSVITSFAFTPYPRKLFAGTSKGQVFSWDLRIDNPTPFLEPPKTGGVPVTALAIHPQAILLAVGSRNRETGFTLYRMRPENKEVLAKFDKYAADNPIDASGPVSSLAFSGDGGWLMARLLDQRIMLWKVKPGELELQKLFPLSNYRLTAGTFGPGPFSQSQARWLFGDVGDGTARVWSLSSEPAAAAPFTLAGHRGPLTAFTFSPDGRRLLTASVDGTNRLWHLDTTVDTKRSTEPRVFRHDAPILAGAFAVKPYRIATCTNVGKLSTWNLDTSEAGAVSELGGHLEFARLASVANGQSMIVSAGALPLRWNLNSATIEGLLTTVNVNQLQLGSFAISADGRRIASFGAGPSDLEVAGLLDRQAENPIWFQLSASDAAKGALSLFPYPVLALSRDGGRLLIADIALGAHIYEVIPGVKEPLKAGVFPPSASSPIRSAALSETASMMAAGSMDGNVWVWKDSKDPFVLHGHRKQVTTLAFTPDGTRLISGSDDGTARIWNTVPDPDSAACVVLTGHVGPITSVVASPDSDLLLTTSTDGTARVWTLDPELLASRAAKMMGKHEKNRR